MQQLTSRRQVHALTVLFVCTYMVSYLTRINYGAVISEMVTDTGFPRTLLSMAVTGSFITYGLGQVISGVLGDHISPKKLISLGLLVTICMNLLISICRDPYQMCAVWCVNGFAQSLMWPPMVRLMTALLSQEDYKTVAAKVNWGASFGTILVYLISPLIISFCGWRYVFVFSACAGLIMLFFWLRYAYEIQPQKRVKTAAAPGSSRLLLQPLVLAIMLSITLQGMLRDGVTTWMPTYISEVFRLDNVVSILTGVILPLFSLLCIQAATTLYTKKLTNPLICAAVLFSAGAAAALFLFLLEGRSAIVSVILSALLTGCMHGVNLMLVCMVPLYFQKYGHVSTISGVINACTYVGSAISTYGIAALSASSGWSTTVFIWFLIALTGTLLCLFSARPWKQRYMQD